MSIIRITEGEYLTHIEKGWTVYTDEFEAYAGQFSHFTAVEKTVFGDPKQNEKQESDYFREGWWSSDSEGNRRITEARIGDTVYFNIITQNIPDIDPDTHFPSIINVQLYDDDGGWGNEPDPINVREITKNPITGEDTIGDLVTTRVVSSNKVSYSLNLSIGLNNFVEEDVGDEIELYLQCSYKEEIAVKLPKNDSDYLIVYKTLFPLIMHQRSFAPWEKFGNLIFDRLRPNNFYGDNRTFSLIDNFLESPENNIELRYSKLKASGKVTSRLYHKVEFDYNSNKISEDKTIAICNLTRGQWFFIPSEHASGYAINESPSHSEFYGEHSLINSSREKGVVNMEIEGNDPLVWGAPDIDWKLLVRLTLDVTENLLHIKGFAYGKEFPAYEAFIEDSNGTRFFLHTFAPLNEFELSQELLWNMPDYFGKVDITIEVDRDNNGYYFKNNLRSALYTYSDLLKEDSYIEVVYENMSLGDWNNMHLNKVTSKDL